MSGFVLSPRAKADIEEIWDYTAVHWGVDQAETYIRQIQAELTAAAAKPTMSRRCDEIRSGYFKQPVGSHVIFFRLASGKIDVVRILHRSMDFDRHL